MSKNDLNMIDLVLTHLNQLWGPPWTLATIGDMPENGQNDQYQYPYKAMDSIAL